MLADTTKPAELVLGGFFVAALIRIPLGFAYPNYNAILSGSVVSSPRE